MNKLLDESILVCSKTAPAKTKEFQRRPESRLQQLTRVCLEEAILRPSPLFPPFGPHALGVVVVPEGPGLFDFLLWMKKS